MLFLLFGLLFVGLLPMVLAILLARWRPKWSYLKVALFAAAPIPVVLTSLTFIVLSRAFFLNEVVRAAAIIIPLFVFGVMAAAVGAWMTPRPPAPVVTTDEIESIFQ